MEPGNPDVISQIPAGGNVMKPASGTYGEKAELERLKQELPKTDPAAAGPQPRQPSAPGPRSTPQAPQGLPSGLFAPTQRPDVPVSAPLDQPVDPFGGAVDARQRRLQYLDILSTHPDASPEVREWADTVKQKLIARG